ncbi:hypothetical protein QR680_016434 [Steinernema hermaphroditum]|uniref:Serpentine receptor class gamma n=1 Tax=Steinernema hermaphroditum TaxID=289476 RepID=A0AA39HB82_9BILA|nr:hypothetical protein QR680_016434 [Steinernema hermaphroditum]
MAMFNSSVLPYCAGLDATVDVNIHHPQDQHLYTGILYISFFAVAIVPQCFLFYTCLEKQNRKESCYKLMLMTSVNDMVNLINCMLTAGIFSVFGIQHCKYGIAINHYGQFVMFFWYSYCFTNLILAFNRLLEFLSKTLSEFLFRGYRTWLWSILVIIYAGSLCLCAPDPFYFYESNAGVWYFFWLGKDTTNYFHVYNNMIKLSLMVIFYCSMLLLLRRQARFLENNVSVFERRLSIQACLIASACAAGNITYLVISYFPMGTCPFTGTFGEMLWGIQHSAAGFVYIAMNKPVRRNVRRFLVCIRVFGAQNQCAVQSIKIT